MAKGDNVWGIRLCNEGPLSATCIVFESAAFRKIGRPATRKRMTEPMSPTAIHQRLNRRVHPGGTPRADHAQRWRLGPREADPILVVVADPTDGTSLSRAGEFCARASQDVLLTVLLLAYPDLRLPAYPLNCPGPCGSLAELAGEMWCALELLSADPYLDAVRVADALTLRTPGLIGVDFEDVRTVLADGWTGARAYHRCNGEKRAEKAAVNVLRKLSALGVSLKRASGLFVHIASGLELKVAEIRAITGLLREHLAWETEVTLSHAYKRKSRLSRAPYLEVDIIVTFGGEGKARRNLVLSC